MWDFGLEEGESFEPVDGGLKRSISTTRTLMTVLGPIPPCARLHAPPRARIQLRQPAGRESDPDQILDDPGCFIDRPRGLLRGRWAGDRRHGACLLWAVDHRPALDRVSLRSHRAGDRTKHLIAAPLVGESSVEDIVAHSVRGTDDRNRGDDRAGRGCYQGRDQPGRDHRSRAAGAGRGSRGAEGDRRADLAHTEYGTMASAQMRMLTDAGADPSRVILCHLDFQLGTCRTLREVIRTGAFVSFDHWSEDAARIGRSQGGRVL